MFVIPQIYFNNTFYIIKDVLGPVVPTNRQVGESCGSCYCPPTYNAGKCAPGLTCKPGPPEISDIPGTCVEQGILPAPFAYNKFRIQASFRTVFHTML